MKPTPIYDLKGFPNVYEPAEDTFLLLDTLEHQVWDVCNPSIVLEVGSGSGVVSAFVASCIGPNALYLCTDINRDAAIATLKTGGLNKVQLNPVLCDFQYAFARMNGLIDVLIFNPPYVVTTPDEIGSRSIEAAWAGGIDGRQVIDRFLPLVNSILSPGGIFFLVVIDENKPHELISIMEKLCFNCTTNTRSAGREKLSVLRFTRANNNIDD